MRNLGVVPAVFVVLNMATNSQVRHQRIKENERERMILIFSVKFN